MAKSKAGNTATKETKTVDTAWGGELTVPISTHIGDNFETKSSLMEIGIDCVFGDNVRLDANEVGSYVRIDYGSSVDEHSTIGNNVTIGANSSIGSRSQIGEAVTVGRDVLIGRNVRVQPGVVIPDNWFIPEGAIVNPGRDGFPVVIMTAPTFRCNVNGQISTGSRSW